MPPALSGIIRYAIRHQWPTLMINAENDRRDSPLMIYWRGSRYRIWCEEVK